MMHLKKKKRLISANRDDFMLLRVYDISQPSCSANHKLLRLLKCQETSLLNS